MKSKLLALAATLVTPAAALAHPGHLGHLGPAAGGSVGWLHYLTDPYHLLIGLLAAVCVVGLAIGPARRALLRKTR